MQVHQLHSCLKVGLASRAVQQSALLIGAQAGAMLLSLLFSIMVARALNPAQYGVFRYAMTFLSLAMTVLQFGWPYSAARLLAMESNVTVQKQLVSACGMLVIISSLIGTALVVATVLAVRSLDYHLPSILLWIAPFIYVTLGQYMVNCMCQGLNRILLLSSQQLIPYLLLVPITAVQIYLLHSYTLCSAVAGYVIIFSIVVALGFVHAGLGFQGWRVGLRMIVLENRQTGLPVYVGGLFGVASTQAVAIWVAAYVDKARYGHYALALAVSAPLSVAISSVGTVIFRSCLGLKTLSKLMLLSSFAFGGFLAIAFIFAAGKLLVPAFGANYKDSVGMAQLMVLGALLIGWGDIFNRFLLAQGKGKSLCRATVATGAAGMLSAAILLPRWGAYGAIASATVSAATYFGAMLYSYRCQTRYCNTVSTATSSQANENRVVQTV